MLKQHRQQAKPQLAETRNTLHKQRDAQSAHASMLWKTGTQQRPKTQPAQ